MHHTDVRRWRCISAALQCTLRREAIRGSGTITTNEGVEFVGGERGRVVVALPDRAGAAEQEVGLFFCLDAFGDGFLTERFGHRQNHLDDRRRVRVS